jgi:hypothetical protein
MGGFMSPGVAKQVTVSTAKRVGDASVFEFTQSLRGDRGPADVPAQSFKPRAVVRAYRNIRVKAEALNAGTAFSRDECNIFCLDSIPEPHHGLARASTRRNSILQGRCRACGEERLFVAQRVLGGVSLVRDQAATLEQANDASGAGCCDAGDLVVVGGRQSEEHRGPRVVRVGIDSVEEDRMKIYVQVHGPTPALNLRHRAALPMR